MYIQWVPRFVSAILAVAIAVSPLCPALQRYAMAASIESSGSLPNFEQGSNGDIFLPLVTNGEAEATSTPTSTSQPTATREPTATPSPTATQEPTATPLPTATQPAVEVDAPEFEIINPIDGSSVSGVLNFAIQALNPSDISTVTFAKGDDELAADNDPSDGFKAFVDMDAFADGEVTLIAKAEGPGGTVQKTVTVNVIADAPSTGIINQEGGVLASEIGSVISFLPGSVPDGTEITVDELTQAETTERHGIDWDSMGVTFLGAQDVQSSAPIEGPFAMVSSAGFGNRVQPGQAVVNYRIAPDADGDGVDEIVVVNTASVAPNGNVVADPIEYPVISTIISSTQNLEIPPAHDRTEIEGSPGTLLNFSLKGINFSSALSNVAIFNTESSSSDIEAPVLVNRTQDTDLAIASVVIPSLTVGNATLRIYNKSTGFMSEPLTLTVKPYVKLSKTPEDTIRDFLDLSIQSLNQQAGLENDTSYQAVLPRAISNIEQLRADFDELLLVLESSSESDKKIVSEALMAAASTIQNRQSQFLSVNSSSFASTCGNGNADFIISGLNDIAYVLSAVPFFVGGPIVKSLLFTLSFTFATVAQITRGLVHLCENSNSNQPQQCVSSPNISSSTSTGMGAAPPSGGPACGDVVDNQDEPQVLSANISQTYQPIAVKIFSNGSATPFTGMTDPGGYFFVPFIPDGEPFTAVAIDTATGDTRRFNGIGPATGDSVYMFFDFYNDEEGVSSALELGDTVSSEILEIGEVDTYTLTVSSEQEVYFDAIEASVRNRIAWQVLEPDGTELLNKWIWAGNDGGAYTLEPGVYTILVSGSNDATGTYQFQIRSEPPDEIALTIGETVSNNAPVAGAGNIELAGNTDIYTFTATIGQRVYFDAMDNSSGRNDFVWRLFDTSGNRLFSEYLNNSDPGAYILELGGEYRLVVTAQDNVAGTYQFQLRSNPPDAFDLDFGTTISDGNPGTGAGNLELPGNRDQYTFQATAGQRVYFDGQGTSGGRADFIWRLYDSSGDRLFSEYLNTTDPGVYILELDGTYTIIVLATSDVAGTYQLEVRSTPPDAFELTPGDTVSDGIPASGAGNIELPGNRDSYSFAVDAGQSVYFDEQGSSGGYYDFIWRLYDSSGDKLFGEYLNTDDPDEIVFDEAGTYTLVVHAATGVAGTYQFQIRSNPSDTFAINFSETIMDGAPGIGAGNLELPGNKDRYTFEATAGQWIYFDEQGTSGNYYDFIWRLYAPSGERIFSEYVANGDTGPFVLEEAGEYQLIVKGNTNVIGTYQIEVRSTPPEEFVIGVGDTVSDGIPGVGAGNIEKTGDRDIYTFQATAGQRVYFDAIESAGGYYDFIWRLFAPDGTRLFSEYLATQDPGTYTLEAGGEYTILVFGNTGESGVYQFQIRDPQ